MSSVSPPPVDPLAALQTAQRSPLELAFDALDRIRRRWPLALLVAVAIPTYVCWRTLQQPIYYQSQVALLLDARPPRVVDKVTEVVAEESMVDTERFAAGQMRLIGSEYLSNIVESQLHLAKTVLSVRLIASIDPRSHV